jgi:hypothetical protein
VSRLALRLASAIDAAESPAAALRALGPQLHKVLEARRPGPPSAIAQLRSAHMNHPAKRKRMG